jgi:hypothetical protein
MCYYDPAQPYAVPLKFSHTESGVMVMDYSLLLGKVTEKRNGEHRSCRNFTYPIGRTVRDSNAHAGSHEYGLHFAASPDSAKHLVGIGYGSHRLGILPAPRIWDPIVIAGQTNRCWHSTGATALFCLDCDDIELDVLTNPDFWNDLTKQSRKSRHGLSFTELLDSNAVWHQRASERNDHISISLN